MNNFKIEKGIFKEYVNISYDNSNRKPVQLETVELIALALL